MFRTTPTVRLLCVWRIRCTSRRCKCLLGFGDLLALALCCECICCSVLAGFEAVQSQLFGRLGFCDDLMYLHVGIYAKYHHIKSMVLFDWTK